MNKQLFKSAIVIMLTVLLTYSCTNSEDLSSSQVLIINNIRDTVPQKFMQKIMNLKEYKSWKDRKREKAWRPYFEVRKLLIGKKAYYHIELVQQYYNELTSSSMPLPQIVCYFRADSANRSIEVIDLESNEFLDLSRKAARKYLEKCFEKN